MAGYTSPYRQHNFIGDHASDGDATTFFQTTLGWGTLGASVGLGVQYFNTATSRVKVWTGSAWADITSSTPTLASVLAAGNSAGSTTINMNSQKITSLANGVDPGDAVNKSQLDSAIAGLSWKDPVLVLDMFDDTQQAGSPPTASSIGETWVADTWGGGYTDGNIYEWDGSQWVDLGALGAGTRVVVTGLKGTGAGGSFAGEDEKFGVYSGTAWSFVAAVDGDAVLVDGDGSYWENNGFTYNGTSWVQFTGTGQINAGAGLTKSGNTLNVGQSSTGGITVNADNIAANVDNSTIEINGTDPGTIRVKDAGITLAKMASDSVDENKIVSTTFSTTGGLQGGSGTKVSVKVAATAAKGGLVTDADGLRSMQFYAGNPNSNVTGVLGEFCMDTSNTILYYCATAGTTGWIVA